MALTIFTVSDPATIGSALTAMAMFFGQDSWVGAAVKTALLLSLLLILAQGVTAKAGLRLDVMLIQLLVVWVMFMPKTTVTIEQFDNAAPPRVVDDVPYGIALPASLAGSFALYMTNKIEAVMVAADGNYLSVSGDTHPFTPARVLMSFTACPMDPMSCIDQNLAETMRLAARHCSGGKLSETRFAKTKSVLESFADTMTKEGQVIIYDKNNPLIPGGGGGRPASCGEVAAYLRSEASILAGGGGGGQTSNILTTMEDISSKAELKRYKSIAQAEAGQKVDWNTSLQSINKVTDANSKIDTLALSNVLTFSIAESLKFNAHAPIDQAISIRRDVGMFEWAKSEVQQSMLVSTTAPKFMDILFFIFIASTPIVMFVVAANPQSGLKVAGSYVLFGMWTQSWIPMMAIITSWYQTEIQNYPAPVAGEGMTVEYIAYLMRHVTTTTIAASNMIQSAPYMMFAIMSGSMMAMSSLIGKAAPSGGGAGADLSGGVSGAGGGAAGGGRAGGGAAGGGGSPAHAQMSAVLGGQAAMANGLASNSVGMNGDVAANLPGLGEMGVGSSVGFDSTAMNSKSSSLKGQLQKQSAKAMSDLSALMTSAGKVMSGAQMASHMKQAGFSADYNATSGVLTSDLGNMQFGRGQNNSTNTGFQMAAGAKMKMGTPEFTNFMAGFSAALEASSTALTGDNTSQTASLQKGRTQSTGSSGGSTTGVRTTEGESGGTGTSGQKGAQWSQMGAQAKQLAKTVSDIASQTKALEDADKLVSQGSSTGDAGFKASIKGSDLGQNWGNISKNQNGGVASGSQKEAASRIERAMGGALVGDDAQKFQKSMAQHQAQMNTDGLGRSLSQDQIAAAAAFKALQGMSASGDTGQRVAAMNGIAALAKASGMGDFAEQMKTVAKAADLMNTVGQNVAAMEKQVTPAVNAAVAKVDDELSKPKTDAHETAVGGRIDSGRSEAAAHYGTARNDADGVKARGEIAAAEETAKVKAIMENNDDPSRLQQHAREADAQRAALAATSGELTTYPMDGNANGFNSTSPTGPKKPDTPAQRELAGVDSLIGIPAKPSSDGPTPGSPTGARPSPLSSVLDGVANAGTTTAGAVVQTIAGASSGSSGTPTTSGGGGSAPAPSAPPGAANAGTTTAGAVVQTIAGASSGSSGTPSTSGGGETPSMGIVGANLLGNSGGGGSTPAPSGPVESPSKKPNQKGGANENANNKKPTAPRN